MLSPSGITDRINNEFLKCQGDTDRMNHYKTLWSKNPINSEFLFQSQPYYYFSLIIF